MYDKEKIERLARVYIETDNAREAEEVFGALLTELEPMIKVQLGKNYSSLKDYWDDMISEVITKLWKNREGIKITKSKVFSYLFYQRIRRDLNRASRKMNKLYRSEEQLPIVTSKDGKREEKEI